jgi:hypothetical protein
MTARTVRAVKPAPAFSVRAVFYPDDSNTFKRSYALDDVAGREQRSPDRFGVYSFYSGWVADYAELVDAETHAAQLNGAQS